MATISHNGGSGGYNAMSRVPYILEEIVNYATIVATPITVGTTDTLQVLKIPAKTFVMSAGYEILTAETTNTTAQLELGDGVDPNRWVAAGVISSAGASAPVATTSALGAVYHTADTIDLLSSVDDPTNAVIRVWAVCVDYSYIADTLTDHKTYTSA